MAKHGLSSIVNLILVCLLWTLINLVHANAQYTAHYSINEGSGEDFLIGNIVTDSGLSEAYDSNILRRFRYAIYTVEYKEVFQVNRASGILRAAVDVDREALCPLSQDTCSITLDVAIVQPTDYFNVIQVHIEVIDLNDNAPTFPEAVHEIRVSENTNPGVKFVVPAAQDADTGENGVQQYRLDSDSSAFALRVNADRGGSADLNLVLVEPVDREEQSQYLMQIVAVDGGQPPRTGSMELVVNILDANDNPPVFTTPVLNVTQREDIPVGTIVASMHAVDADEGVNGLVTYGLVDYPNCSFHGENQNVLHLPEQCLFSVNSDSGDIVLRTKLDYETVTSHLILVSATDQGPNNVPIYARVLLNVEDVNDVAPVININAVGSGPVPGTGGGGPGGPSGDEATESFSVIQVTENLPPDSFVAYVSAEDDDGGKGGEVTCFIDDDTNFNIERMFQQEYKITTRYSMDREVQAQYDVIVTCKDQGDPSLSSEYILLVNIVDVNDNPPVFTQALYTAELKENNAINVSILRVLAEDADDGKNAEVSYHIHSTYRSLFTIDQNTGILRPKVVFDREKSEHVEAQILAKDQGTPSKTGATMVRIRILDDNDNPPLFSAPSYNFGVAENRPHGTEIGVVSAIDQDSEPYAKFHFSLISLDDNGYLPFVIDRFNGKITTTRSLDREKASSYNLQAIVTDSGNENLFSKANVTVYITDTNDNQPIINFPSSFKDKLIIKEIPKTGSTVAVIKATDMDLGDNARLKFDILHGNDWGLWHVGHNTGEIIYVGSGGPPPASEHLLVIVAKDDGVPQLSATAQLTIIFNVSYAEVDPMVNIYEPLDPNTAENSSPNSAGIGPVLQFRIILVLAIVTTFIVLILVAIIIVLRRRQRRERRRKKQPLPAQNSPIHDHTYLFVNNNEGAAGSGFVKGVCETSLSDKLREKELEPGDGTSLLDIDLSSSGISMGSEAATEKYSIVQYGQYHLSPMELKERFDSDWLHNHRHRKEENNARQNAKNEPLASNDSTPLTIRNIAVDLPDKYDPKSRRAPPEKYDRKSRKLPEKYDTNSRKAPGKYDMNTRSLDNRHCNTGPPKPPVRNLKGLPKKSNCDKCPISPEFVEVRPTTSNAKPVTSQGNSQFSFRTFHPNGTLSNSNSLKSISSVKNVTTPTAGDVSPVKDFVVKQPKTVTIKDPPVEQPPIKCGDKKPNGTLDKKPPGKLKSPTRISATQGKSQEAVV